MGVDFLWPRPALEEGSTRWKQKSRCWAQRGQHCGWGSSSPGVTAVSFLAQAQISWHLCWWVPVTPPRELRLGLE